MLKVLKFCIPLCYKPGYLLKPFFYFLVCLFSHTPHILRILIQMLFKIHYFFVSVAEILALCAPLPNRNTETVTEEKERVALLLCQAKGERSYLVPQELCSLSLVTMKSLCEK